MLEKNKKNKQKLNDLQISDIVVKHIIEKILSNVSAKLFRKKINKLLPTICLSYLFNELKAPIQEFYMCREIDPILIKNNPQVFYDRCFTDNEPINEIEIIQPKPPKLDRWKIFRIPIVKMNDLNINRIEEAPLEEENKKKKKTIRYKSYKKYAYFRELKEKEEEENKKKNKNQLMDLPCYPIEDFEKRNVLIFKGDRKKPDIIDYQELNKYYLDQITLEEEKKQKELDKKLNLINSIKSIKEPKKIYEKYRGKNVNVDHNGKIVLIKEIKIENLQNEFTGLNSKLNEKYKKIISRKSIKINTKTNINREKPKIERMRDTLKKRSSSDLINNQEGRRIIAGSSFDRFYPEVGVAIKEGNAKKDGGLNFYNKYNKFDMVKFNSTMIDLNRELNNKMRNHNNNNSMNDIINNSSNIINNSNNLNEDNSNNYQSLYKTIYKSLSLPDINLSKNTIQEEPSNINYKKVTNKNNSMTIRDKNESLYTKKYFIQNDIESNFIKYGKYIKANDSFKKILLERDDNDISINKIRNKSNDYLNNMYNTSKHRKIEDYNYLDKYNYKYNEINDFNRTILGNRNWGKDSLLNNKSYNSKNSWYKNRFFIKNKNFNPYSTIRAREKNKKLQNISNAFNVSENDYVLKFLNKSNDK